METVNGVTLQPICTWDNMMMSSDSHDVCASILALAGAAICADIDYGLRPVLAIAASASRDSIGTHLDRGVVRSSERRSLRPIRSEMDNRRPCSLAAM
jgi:hypothetical protein